jgi:restriction system protein
MRQYFRVMLGSKSRFADECHKGNFIGADFGIHQDLSSHLSDNWREFNKTFIPLWQELHPGKSKVAAGLSCGALWTVAKGIQKADIILSPNGMGSYFIGEVMDNYSYHPNEILPHRRTINWFDKTVERALFTDALRNSSGSIGTVSDVSKYAEEIESLIGGSQKPVISVADTTIEDAATFALEKHLEAFLVENWKQTDLGRSYDIFEEDGELVG